MQSTSWETLDWKKHKLESRLQRNINNLRYADETTLIAESEEELKSLLIKMKEENEKVGLKLNIQKTKLMASGLITSWEVRFSSVQFSRSVVSDSLRPHKSQHARPPCPSPSPGVHSDSRPSSQWCHPAISSSVIPFSSCPNPSQHQSLFQWVNTWDGQSTGVSASASFLPKKPQGWSPSQWAGWICLPDI